jgi:hypothetical protein
MAHSPTRSDSSASSDGSPNIVVPPAPATVIQQLNIRNHVPIVLDLKEPNYSQWRCFFDSVLGKFGLGPHVFSPPPLTERDAEWLQNDHAVVNWLYTTIAKSVFDNVYKPDSSAFTVWCAIEGLFRDNEMERAVYLEAELRTLQQGEMSINDYCTRLKTVSEGLIWWLAQLPHEPHDALAAGVPELRNRRTPVARTTGHSPTTRSPAHAPPLS